MVYFVAAVVVIALALYVAVMATAKLCDYLHEAC